MKIIIMTDLEGVAGVLNARDFIYPESRYYEHACELATLEVSAAVEGALQAGASEVIVADGHGHGAMKRSLLHPRAKLLAGRPVPDAFGWTVDGTFAAAMSVGQHAKSNTDGGHLAHTGSFRVEEEQVNGLSVGELGRWMLMCGYFGVPVIFVAGDAACCEEARALVPNVETTAVKWGIKRGSASGLTAQENEVFNSVAIHLSPDEARQRIRDGAYRAVKRLPEIVPFRMDGPYTMTVSLRPERSGGRPRTAQVKSKDLLDLLLSGRITAYSKLLGGARSARVRKPPAKTRSRGKAGSRK
jgi:D-amino peptidase